jgi:hypothetical protein
LPSPILARADALMHRKRQTDSDFDDLPVLTDAVDDDDIPLLLDAEVAPTTDIAATEEWPEEIAAAIAPETAAETPGAVAPAEEAAPSAAPSPTLDPGLRDLLVHELARRVEQRLSAELPRIIESTVRDFLAEQEMIASHTAQD